jgi:hypothetical protein
MRDRVLQQTPGGLQPRQKRSALKSRRKTGRLNKNLDFPVWRIVEMCFDP